LEVDESIKGRRSIRKYLDKEVPEALVKRVLEAACWAPSAHNAQPWSFVIINNSETKKRFAFAMGERWNEDLKKNGISDIERERMIQMSTRRFSDSPVVILVCLSMKEMHSYADEPRQLAEHLMAIQSVAAAIQNILLAIYAEGLGACWYCAPLFCPETVRGVLGIPEDIEPQALITMGYPNEKPSPAIRKPLKVVVHLNRWGYHW